MASGHINRANRPNTWLHRPACRREESLANSEPSTHGTKQTLPSRRSMSAFGGKADDPAAFARYGQKSANGRIAAVFCRASVQRRDAGLLNDAGPQLDFAFEKCPNLLRRIGTALVAERHQTPLHVRIGERGNRVGIHFRDDFAWSLSRHEKRVPGNHVKAGDTVLGDRWYFGGDGGALGAGVTERPHLARSRIVERGAAGEEEMHATGNKVVHRRGSATIRHMHHLDAGHVLE